MANVVRVLQVTGLMMLTFCLTFVLSTLVVPRAHLLPTTAISVAFAIVLACCALVVGLPLLVLARRSHLRASWGLAIGIGVGAAAFLVCASILSDSSDTLEGTVRFWMHRPLTFAANLTPFLIAGSVFGVRFTRG